MYRFDKHRTTNHLSLVNDLVWWVAVYSFLANILQHGDGHLFKGGATVAVACYLLPCAPTPHSVSPAVRSHDTAKEEGT